MLPFGTSDAGATHQKRQGYQQYLYSSGNLQTCVTSQYHLYSALIFNFLMEATCRLLLMGGCNNVKVLSCRTLRADATYKTEKKGENVRYFYHEVCNFSLLFVAMLTPSIPKLNWFYPPMWISGYQGLQ